MQGLGCDCMFPTDLKEADQGGLPPLRPLGTPLTPRALLPQHREDLYRSGLSDKTIQQSRCHSLTQMRVLREILHWRQLGHYDDDPLALGPSLVFPYPDLGGLFDGFARLKPDRPRTRESGAVVKYEQPAGCPLRAYFPRSALEAMRDSLAPLGFTEGEKKALKASQEGLPCIGLAGVWGWQQRRERDDERRPIGERQLLDDLQRIPWKGRSVWIAFDADVRRNPQVNHAVAELARVLSELGADV